MMMYGGWMVMLWCVWVVLSACVASSPYGRAEAFVVQVKAGQNENVTLLVPQLTAAFGPPSHYYVPGRLHLIPGNHADAQLLCQPIPDPKDPLAMARAEDAKRKFAGLVLMALRGGCSFMNKTYNAIQSGAIGLIIGNTDNEFIKMGPDGKDYDINMNKIPVVSIEKGAYDALLEYQLEDQMRLPLVLNDEGEIDDWGQGFFDDMNIIGYTLMCLPLIWGFFLISVHFRRRIAERRNATRRAARTVELPVVKYTADRANGTGGASNTFQTISGDEKKSLPSSLSGKLIDDLHNDACAICLDDFEEEMDVRLLPCRHGFHPPCIDPWLSDRSDECPICKRSVMTDEFNFDVPGQSRFAGCCPSWGSRRDERYNPLLLNNNNDGPASENEV